MRLVLVLLAMPLFAQQTIVLRPAPAGAPAEKIEERGNAQLPDRSITGVSEPTLTVYLPDPAKANGGSVILCPGGGYGHLAIDKEGHDVARWLQSIGYAGFVLKYRLPGSMKGSLESVQEAAVAVRVAIEDATEAVKQVRANAAKWKLKPDRVGMMGFSAGGHLAAMMGILAPADARPDFLVLAYPAIPKNLGTLPETVPPTFIVAADDDRLAPSANSVPFYLALKQIKRPTELLIYSSGGHGFGIRQTKATSAAWTVALQAWLAERFPY